MAIIKQGGASVEVSDSLELDPRAGKMSPDEVRATPRARRGVAVACLLAAAALEKAGDDFIPPPGLTPEALRQAAAEADALNELIADLEYLLNKLKQGDLINDSKAHTMLRRLNNHLKAQAIDSPQLNLLFADVLAYFGRDA